MDRENHVVYKVEDRSYFAIIKKGIHAMALKGGFSEMRVGEIDIVVAEMVSNLVKHAASGQVLVKLFQENNRQGIEIISIDQGPGMMNVNRMMADGFSTKNSLGQGLGAMKRLADVFQVYSQKDWGTIILARIFNNSAENYTKPPASVNHLVMVPKPGEVECGDGFFSSTTKNHIRVFLGDGLGHGVMAANAVTQAGKAFHECESNDPVEIIRHINDAVKKTRGLVGTVAVFDLDKKEWSICGIGNISTKIINVTQTKNYMAYNGIIGLNVPGTLNLQTIPYEKGQHLIMCSDGIKSRWETARYPGILRYDLSILSAAIYKDHGRQTDDMSVLTCKINL